MIPITLFAILGVAIDAGPLYWSLFGVDVVLFIIGEVLKFMEAGKD